MAKNIILTIEDNATYADGKPESREAVNLATFKAFGKRAPRNFVAGSADDKAAGIAGWLVTRARPRRVTFNGSGLVMTSLTGNARAIKSVSMPATDAASLVGLTAEEAEVFVSRFPSDGTVAGKPADTDAVAAVFRKVNAYRGRIDIAPSAAVETLA